MANNPSKIHLPCVPWRMRKESIRFHIKVFIESQPQAKHEYYRSKALESIDKLDCSKGIPFPFKFIFRAKHDLRRKSSPEIEERIIQNPIPKTERMINLCRDIPLRRTLFQLQVFIQACPKESRGDVKEWFIREVSNMKLFPLKKHEYEEYMRDPQHWRALDEEVNIKDDIDPPPTYKESLSTDGAKECLPQYGV